MSMLSSSVKQENKFKIISDKKCSAKFGASWYDGNILATAGSKREANHFLRNIEPQNSSPHPIASTSSIHEAEPKTKRATRRRTDVSDSPQRKRKRRCTKSEPQQKEEKSLAKDQQSKVNKRIHPADDEEQSLKSGYAHPSNSKSDSEDDLNVTTRKVKTGVLVYPANAVKCCTGIGKDTNKILYPKENWCLYCEKYLSNIQRHYELRHAKEQDVSQIICTKDAIKNAKDEEEKKNLVKKKENYQAILRNRGNFKHNTEVLRAQKGELSVVRRPENETDAAEYLPCINCYGFFMAYDIYKHDCPGSDEKHQLKRKGEMLLHETLCPDEEITEETMKIISLMRAGSLKEVILGDKMIIKFISYLVEKHSVDATNQENYIRERSRILGKFLLRVRQEEDFEEIDLFQLLSTPKNYDVVAKCAQLVSENNVELPRKIGHSVQKCLIIMKGVALRASNHKLIRDLQLFDELMATEWSDLVSSKTLKRQHQQKMNKGYPLPTTEDVTKLFSNLKKASEEAYTALLQNLTEPNWRNLAECLLGSIIVFNKRRAGEASRIKIDDVKNSNKRIKIQEEFRLALSEHEKEMIAGHFVIYSSGKRGRHVPTILTKEMQKHLDILLQKREEIGVPEENKFVFSIPEKLNHLSACRILKKFANQTGVKNCTSTSLRKYLATTLQVLNLSDEEKDQVFRHMGHSRAVHEHYYCMDERTVEAAKLSKLLHLNSTGALHSQAGKSLAELEYNPEDFEAESEEEDAGEQAEEAIEEQTEEIEKKTRKRRFVVPKEEKIKILGFFASAIGDLKIPAKKDIMKFESNLQWTQVKNVIGNEIAKEKKEKKSKRSKESE